MKIAAFALAATLAFATLAPAQESNRTLNERRVDQQQRIRNGVVTGEMTPREARHVERQAHSIHREERNMRFNHNGRLTRRDRAILQRRQNRQSRRIYRANHNLNMR